jgi:hypothetical protein
LKKKALVGKQQGKRPQVQDHAQPRVEERSLPKKNQANALIVEKSSERSPDSNPRGLALPQPELRWTYRVEAQFSVGLPMRPSVQNSYQRYGKFLGRARLIRIPSHLVLQTVGLPLYLTYGIRIGILPPEFEYFECMCEHEIGFRGLKPPSNHN